MRIEFVKEHDVDISTTPKQAWGRLQIRAVPRIPNFTEVTQEVAAVLVRSGHYFPTGAIVDLPDDISAELVEMGVAKVHIGARGAVLFGVERPDEPLRAGTSQ